MNYDVMRLLRLWIGWLFMALAHRLARVGNVLAGPDAELVEPVRPALTVVGRRRGQG